MLRETWMKSDRSTNISRLIVSVIIIIRIISHHHVFVVIFTMCLQCIGPMWPLLCGHSECGHSKLASSHRIRLVINRRTSSLYPIGVEERAGGKVPPNFGENIFLANVMPNSGIFGQMSGKFVNFVNFSGKYCVKFGYFVNFFFIHISSGKNVLLPQS